MTFFEVVFGAFLIFLISDFIHSTFSLVKWWWHRDYYRAAEREAQEREIRERLQRRKAYETFLNEKFGSGK